MKMADQEVVPFAHITAAQDANAESTAGLIVDAAIREARKQALERGEDETPLPVSRDLLVLIVLHIVRTSSYYARVADAARMIGIRHRTLIENLHQPSTPFYRDILNTDTWYLPPPDGQDAGEGQLHLDAVEHIARNTNTQRAQCLLTFLTDFLKLCLQNYFKGIQMGKRSERYPVRRQQSVQSYLQKAYHKVQLAEQMDISVPLKRARGWGGNDDKHMYRCMVGGGQPIKDGVGPKLRTMFGVSHSYTKEHGRNMTDTGLQLQLMGRTIETAALNTANIAGMTQQEKALAPNIDDTEAYRRALLKIGDGAHVATGTCVRVALLQGYDFANEEERQRAFLGVCYRLPDGTLTRTGSRQGVGGGQRGVRRAARRRGV